ncbi:YheC/YheD family protein [Priestia flexa]|uniref:YheC/YheD family protein n=1 Tax=Priestia flexa TaxID=86664 RepID=A0A8I1SN61_9BACI|nr:YheC/YheD family protein [Priestia flexa]MBN8253547.1 YheC/YheD family protein [Priestia flexa]
MISLGFITIHPEQEVEYATNLAKYAAAYNIEFYRFTPFQLQPVSQKITGYKYNSEINEWQYATFSLPMFIYDRCFYRGDSLSKKAIPIVNWLKQNPTITFLGYGLPNKWDVYTELIKDDDLSPYLPSTTKITAEEQVTQLLRLHDALILKPIAGAQGKGIVKLVQRFRIIEASFHSKKGLQTKQFTQLADFHAWLFNIMQNATYLAQPFIPLLSLQYSPLDVRVLLQKDASGDWNEIGRGVRKGKEDSFITNISHGASISPFEELMKRLPPHKATFITDEISSLCERIPLVLEAQLPSLFELGLDICISRDYSIWLLDLNSKPGRKTIIETTPESTEKMYENVMAYCSYLATLPSSQHKE